MIGLKQAKHNTAMQFGRQIGQVCFSYATDNIANGNLYPADSTGLAISQDLINANYVTDPSVFAIISQVGYQAPTSSGSAITLKQQSVSWSYTCVSLTTTGGLSSSASDLTPLVYFNNGFGTAVTPNLKGGGGAVSVTYGADAPFGTDGVAVFYKGNNAVYLKAGLAGGSPGQITAFISANDTDSTTYTVAP